MNKKIIFIGLLGAVFFITGLYFRFTNNGTTDIAFEYLGVGTWIAGIAFFSLFPKYKEIISFLLGLIVLHAGVLLILKDQYPNPKFLGFLVFICGIVFVLSSGFSDFIRNRKKI